MWNCTSRNGSFFLGAKCFSISDVEVKRFVWLLWLRLNQRQQLHFNQCFWAIAVFWEKCGQLSVTQCVIIGHKRQSFTLFRRWTCWYLLKLPGYLTNLKSSIIKKKSGDALSWSYCVHFFISNNSLEEKATVADSAYHKKCLCLNNLLTCPPSHHSRTLNGHSSGFWCLGLTIFFFQLVNLMVTCSVSVQFRQVQDFYPKQEHPSLTVNRSHRQHRRCCVRSIKETMKRANHHFLSRWLNTRLSST